MSEAWESCGHALYGPPALCTCRTCEVDEAAMAEANRHLDALIQPLDLRALATALNAYLKRFERDGLLNLYNSGCYYMGGARLRITYRSYEGGTTLSREKGSRYLAWLESGKVGRHTDFVPANEHASTQKLDGPK